MERKRYILYTKTDSHSEIPKMSVKKKRIVSLLVIITLSMRKEKYISLNFIVIKTDICLKQADTYTSMGN